MIDPRQYSEAAKSYCAGIGGWIVSHMSMATPTINDVLAAVSIIAVVVRLIRDIPEAWATLKGRRGVQQGLDEKGENRKTCGRDEAAQTDG